MKRFFARARGLLLCALLGAAGAQTGRAQLAVTNFDSLENALSNGVPILWTSDATLTLSTAAQVLNIASNAIFDGGTNVAVINRSSPGRIFYVQSNATLTLRNLTITDGSSTSGGAIYNLGTVIVSNCIFTANSATNSSGAAGANATGNGDDNGGNGGNGGGAAGGAIYSLGVLQITHSFFSNNLASAGNGGNGGNGAEDFVFGGSGGDGGSGGNAQGGAIVCAGSNNVFLSTEFFGNSCTAGVGGTGGSGAPAPFSGGNGSGSEGSGGGGAGGAVLVSGKGPLFMTNCLFTANSVSGGTTANGGTGGGVYGGGLDLSDSTGSNYIENSTFFQNTGTAGAAAVGGGVASAAALTWLVNCTFSDNVLSGASTSGWNLARLTGMLQLGDSVFSAGTNSSTEIITLTNVVDTTNYTTNFEGILPISVTTNITVTTNLTTTTNNLVISGPNMSGGVTDLGYNISSDASASFTSSTSRKNEAPIVDSAGPPGGNTVNTNAAGIIPGIPGITFPATDEALVLRSTPTSAGAYEANPLISTNGTVPIITAQPPAKTAVEAGSTVVLDVAAISTNASPVGYQWQLNGTNLFDGANISGAWSNVLTLQKVSLANAGTYTALVGSSTVIGVATSTVSVLVVIATPAIQTQPVKKLNPVAGSSATLTVKASGSEPLFYQWRKNGTSFGDGGEFSGSSSNTLNISPVTALDNGSYSVIVTNDYDAVTSTVCVLSVAADTVAPTVAISSPAANARTASPALIGTASDNPRVTRVNFWLTNLVSHTTFSGLASLVPAGGAMVSWTVPSSVVPLPGTNILTVQSVDYSGRSSQKISRAFYMEIPVPVTVNLGGDGGGATTGTAAMRGDTLPANGATLNLGESYTITAVPDANSLFSNWVSNTGLTTNNPVLKFSMESNLVLTANFTTNFFLAAAGAYNGLFYPASGVAEENSGMLYNLVVGKTGAYSGSLLLAGKSYALKGKFDVSGHASNSFGSSKAPEGLWQVALTFDQTTPQILGIVSNLEWSANLIADLAADPLPPAEYTFLFAPTASVTSPSPPGDGYSLVTNRIGGVTLSGALADGTAFSQTVPVSQAGDVPVYASLYANTGLLLGWINLTNLEAAPPANVLAWIKKPSRASALYPGGFTNLLSTQGSLWTNPPAITLTNGQLLITNTTLSLAFNVAASDNTTLEKLSGSPTNSLTGTINAKTGLLSITFGNGKGKNTTAGKGAVLQDQTNGGGFFLTATNAGSILLEPAHP